LDLNSPLPNETKTRNDPYNTAEGESEETDGLEKSISSKEDSIDVDKVAEDQEEAENKTDDPNKDRSEDHSGKADKTDSDKRELLG
jgi:hypothetical protein